MRLQGRVALVTGGGSGIGRAIALRFAHEGAAIAVLDRNLDAAQACVEEIEAAGGAAYAWRTDVGIENEVNDAVAQSLSHFGYIDVLVNNAAISQGDDIRTYSGELWDMNLNVVLKSVFLCSRAVLPAMIERAQGVVVNIASVNGLTGLGEEAYSAAKAGVINLTKNMAVKYGQFGIRANVICPGTIETPIWAPLVREDPSIFNRLSAWYPLGRVGQPEDVANAALFLASDEAAWITGATLAVDGGLTAGSYRMSRALSGDE